MDHFDHGNSNEWSCRQHLREDEHQRGEGHSAESSTIATPPTPATPTTNATSTSNATPIANATNITPATPTTSAISPDDATPRKNGGKRKVPETPSRSGKKPRNGSLGNSSASQTCQDDKSDKVKEAVDKVRKKLGQTEENNIVSYLRESIEGLEPDKKELVGVFGRTGAGKSSLINAVIEQQDLLPTGSMEACTSVIIEVEANTENNRYIGKVKFISTEDFNNELDFLRPYFGAERKKCDDDDQSKLTALFGDEWKNKSLDSLKESKRYKDIVKTLEKKTLEFSCPESHKQKLGEDLKTYMKDESTPSKTWYWPLVKNVTIKVPNNQLLHHVTLVDLPGNGDSNKTRNEMWKKMVSSCGTVWVVTEVNRAASEQEAWEILESACKHMGHGGQCREIHFICNKLDDEMRKENKKESPRTVADIKEEVKNKVEQRIRINEEFMKHFRNDCFEVFSVSAEAYFNNENLLTPEQTGIPELQNVIKNINSQQERASRYVSAAFGILSLMQGAHTHDDKQTEQVRQKLSQSVKDGLENIDDTISGWCDDFEHSLTEGVTEAKASCETTVRKIITDNNHYRTLKSVVEKNGVHKPRKDKEFHKEINLNTALSSFLTKRIDNRFRKVFPNDHKTGSFYSIINDFSLNTERLLKENGKVELWLRFLQQEEEKLKRKLCHEILSRKKSMYGCLTETVLSEMQPCYEVAKAHRKKDSLKNMRETILQHLAEKKSSMFDLAKKKMLDQLNELMTFVTNELQTQMDKVINLPLSHGEVSAELPDISEEYSTVEDQYLYWSQYQKN